MALRGERNSLRKPDSPTDYAVENRKDLRDSRSLSQESSERSAKKGCQQPKHFRASRGNEIKWFTAECRSHDRDACWYCGTNASTVRTEHYEWCFHRDGHPTLWWHHVPSAKRNAFYQRVKRAGAKYVWFHSETVFCTHRLARSAEQYTVGYAFASIRESALTPGQKVYSSREWKFVGAASERPIDQSEQDEPWNIALLGQGHGGRTKMHAEIQKAADVVANFAPDLDSESFPLLGELRVLLSDNLEERVKQRHAIGLRVPWEELVQLPLEKARAIIFE